jgi:predicted MFS family arabinose efflux permease
MAFTLGGALGQVWGGVSVDRFGMLAFAGGGVVLLLISMWFLMITHKTQPAPDLRKEDFHG